MLACCVAEVASPSEPGARSPEPLVVPCILVAVRCDPMAPLGMAFWAVTI